MKAQRTENKKAIHVCQCHSPFKELCLHNLPRSFLGRSDSSGMDLSVKYIFIIALSDRYY